MEWGREGSRDVRSRNELAEKSPTFLDQGGKEAEGQKKGEER